MIEPPMSAAARTSARDLVASGLLDLDWIGAQLGTQPASAEDAARAVINTPDISPHPLFEATWLPGKGVWQAGDLPPSLWYVTEGPRRNRLAPHPLINTERILEENPGARDHEFGPLAWWSDHATRETPMPVRRGYPHLQWGEFRDNALRAAREWQVLSYLDANPGAHQHSPEAAGPVVTVLMSAQDVGPLLAPTIAALQDQTLDQWELLVLDRGSIDATSTVATEAATRDPRVRVVLGSRTQLGRTLNRGIQRARGEFLAFLEPGHHWHPEFLARGVGVLRAGDRSAVHAFTGRDTRLSGELVTPSQFDLGTTLVRRTTIDEVGSFDEGESEETVATFVDRLRSSMIVGWANPLVLVRGVTADAPAHRQLGGRPGHPPRDRPHQHRAADGPRLPRHRRLAARRSGGRRGRRRGHPGPPRAPPADLCARRPAAVGHQHLGARRHPHLRGDEHRHRPHHR